MAEEEDTMEKTRIYVGGLGEAVTGDDLHKVFSSLGIVGEVEIVRTKGRSFAYVDFVPTVSNSISKLFSTYNGCVWKGGRLKLEKAKEHYLAKLRKEWEEDVQLAATNPSMDVDATLEKPLKIDKKTDTRQLRLFIPRLGKVKPLPLSGTGKHKYSFRRVEARSVPLFFCDCKDHAGSYTSAEMQNQDENDGVMNEQEINTMNLVMKKLFEKENVPIVNDTMQAKEHNDQPLDKSESDDEDDLIINVVSRRKNNSAFSGTSEEKRMSTKRTRSDGIQASREESIHKEQKVSTKNGFPAKKMKHLLSEEGKMNEAVTAVPGGEEDLAHDDEADADLGSDEDDLVINVLSKGNKRKDGKKEIASSSQELRTSAIPKSEDEIVENAQKVQKKKDLPSTELRQSLPDKGSNKSVEKRGPLIPPNVSDSDLKARPWSQKSSWKALVGDKEKSSFSLSSILANNVPIEKEPVPSERKMDKKIESKNKMVVTSEEGMPIEPKMQNNIEIKNKILVTCENPEEEPMSSEPKMDNDVEMVTASENMEEPTSIEPKMDNNVEIVTASENLEEPISVEPKMDKNIEMAASENLEGILGEKEKDNMVAVAQATNIIDAGPSEYGRGSSWLHTSSWVQLVSDKSNAFSITDVLPVTAKEALVEVPSSNYEYGMKPGENETNGKDTTTLEVHSIAAGNHVDNEDAASAPVVEKGDSSSSKKAVGGDVKIGETCNFMRSAESLKEWSKLKAALSKSRKRKGNDK